MINRLLLALLSAFGAVGGVMVGASAQDFPQRSVTIVSPYQAGGTSDIIIRVLGQKLSERWGQAVVVENKPGASGAIGVNAVVRAPADGHTLLAVTSNGQARPIPSNPRHGSPTSSRNTRWR